MKLGQIGRISPRFFSGANIFGVRDADLPLPQFAPHRCRAKNGGLGQIRVISRLFRVRMTLPQLCPRFAPHRCACSNDIVQARLTLNNTAVTAFTHQLYGLSFLIKQEEPCLASLKFERSKRRERNLDPGFVGL
jgi:hypothetical protein